MIRTITLAAAIALVASPALAKKETFWIEKVAIIAVGQGACGAAINDDTMQMTIGSAMIEHAMNKQAVVERARKRAHHIVADLQKQKSQNTFCQAIGYYLQNGYPR